MSSPRSIGLLSAILININVIIGSGIFINLHPLMSMGGSGSFIVYGLAALFLLPVVVTLALLAREHPESGGLYVYTKTYLHPFIGFLCGWGYFVGKAVSVGLMAHILVLFAERVLPGLHTIPHIILVASFLGMLAGANIVGASLQGGVQWLFIAAKALPVLFVVGLLGWHGVQVPLSFEALQLDVLGNMVPIAVYAMIGFEVTCSIAHLFVRPQYTIVRAFIIGFFSVISILSLFQYAVAALLPASALTVVPNMPAAQLLSVAAAYISGFSFISMLLCACVYLSVLGGTFSILTSNCWNLYRLAMHGHVPGSAFLTRVTKGNVPWVCLLVQGAVAVLAVGITGHQVPLQKMSILGVVFAFWCAMLAASRARTAQGTRLVHPCIVGAALLSTSTLIALTLYQIYYNGVSLPYIVLMGAGVLSAAWYQFRA